MTFSKLGRKAATLLSMSALVTMLAAGCAGRTNMVNQEQTGPFRVNAKMDPVMLNPPQTATLTFSVTDTRTGKLVTAYEEVSGALMHNVVIGRDLQYFRHSFSQALVEERDGPTVVDSHASVYTYFPGPGQYISYTMLKPQGAETLVFSTTITTGGEGAEPALEPTKRGNRTQGWLTFNLATEGDTIKSGRPAQLIFNVTERGSPVTSLWPYLDAPAHLWLVDERANNLAHLEAAAEGRMLLPTLTPDVVATEVAGGGAGRAATGTAQPTGRATGRATGTAQGTVAASRTQGATPGRGTPTGQDVSAQTGSETGGTGAGGAGDAGVRTGGPSAPFAQETRTPRPVPTLVPALRIALATITAQPQQTLAPVQQTAQAYLAATPGLLPSVGYGPNLVFTHTFPREGLYKMWLEVLYRGQVVLVDYVVRVVD